MKTVTAIGMMSGTSMDGIDVALVRSNGDGDLERGPSGFYAYDAEMRGGLEAALEIARTMKDRRERPSKLAEIEEAITRRHIGALASFLEDHGFRAGDIDVIGFHGQTVLHRPEEGLTVQLGDAALLAEKSGIDVVFDMRQNDMENGGQGAPLAPVYHRALAGKLPEPYRSLAPVCFVNIGGISNVTFIAGDLIAFDSGPGNGLLDQWMQRHRGVNYDKGGEVSASGQVDRGAVAKFLEHHYFADPPPKSLDRGDFTLSSIEHLSLEDGARTLCRMSAEAVVRSVDHLPQQPALWVICGGGRHNPVIMADLTELTSRSGSQVIAAEEAGFDGDTVEAEAWAYMAARSLAGLPLTYPGTTGVSSPVSGGVLVRA